MRISFVSSPTQPGTVWLPESAVALRVQTCRSPENSKGSIPVLTLSAFPACFQTITQSNRDDRRALSWKTGCSGETVVLSQAVLLSNTAQRSRVALSLPLPLPHSVLALRSDSDPCSHEVSRLFPYLLSPVKPLYS